MALAGARGAEDEAVGPLVEPGIAGGQRHHPGLGQHRYGRELKVVQALAGQQPGVAQVALDAPPVTLGQLMLGQGAQQSRRGPALGIGPFAETRPQLLHRRQPQFREHQGQLDGIDRPGGADAVGGRRHDTAPMLLSSGS